MARKGDQSFRLRGNSAVGVGMKMKSRRSPCNHCSASSGCMVMRAYMKQSNFGVLNVDNVGKVDKELIHMDIRSS